METNETPAPKRIQLVAINPYLETHIVTGEESEARGHDYICWGADNDFPAYLRQLVDEVPTLGSVVNGCTDYCVGDGATLHVPAPQGDGRMNTSGDSIDDLLRVAFRSWWIYGCVPIEVIRTAGGQLAEIYIDDGRYIRSDKENDRFWYSEKWGDKYSRKSKVVTMPKWMAGGLHDRSLFYVKNTDDRTYPAPVYGSALIACDLERRIARYHLNAIANGFSASYFINLNNGVPNPEQQDEVEKQVNQKFAGDENAGRVVVGFSDDRAHAPIFQKMDHDDWGTRYQELEKYSRAQIFTSFRANPNLFGLPTENLGFNNEEYATAFELFNRTMIRPAQRQILAAFDRILGADGAVTIKPFSLEV